MVAHVLLLSSLAVPAGQEAPDTLTFATLAAGGQHTCGIVRSGETYCWGSNQYGQIGDGTRTGPQDPRRYPTLVAGGLGFSALALGSRFTCALTEEGAAYCWGYNYDGQIGNDTDTGENFAPTAVKTDVKFRAITAGHYHVCALAETGDAYCWGSSSQGQVGDGRSWNRMNMAKVPTKVVGGHTFNQLATAFDFSCGLAASGEVYCWGGVDLTEWSDSIYRRPAVVSQGKSFDHIASAGDHLCALKQQVAWCWGQNRQGQLGDSTWTRRNAPVAVTGEHAFYQLTTGSVHTCGITPQGKAFCWGEDHVGQLGTGDRQYAGQGQPWPLAVYGDYSFAQIVAGASHTCALLTNGWAMCWGDNRQSQIGQDRTKYNYRNFPNVIVGAPSSE
jgi:alpha-tubulin suppressor-like RCC1 family protein